MKGSISAYSPLDINEQEVTAILSNSVIPAQIHTTNKSIRAGKVMFSCRISVNLKRRMKQAALDTDCNIEQCVEQAFTAWLSSL